MKLNFKVKWDLLTKSLQMIGSACTLITVVLLLVYVVEIKKQNAELRELTFLLLDLRNLEREKCLTEKKIIDGMYNRDSTGYVHPDDRPIGGMVFSEMEETK